MSEWLGAAGTHGEEPRPGDTVTEPSRPPPNSGTQAAASPGRHGMSPNRPTRRGMVRPTCPWKLSSIIFRITFIPFSGASEWHVTPSFPRSSPSDAKVTRRQKLFSDLTDRLGRPVVTFFTSFRYPVSIDDTDVEMMEGLLRTLDMENGVAELLASAWRGAFFMPMICLAQETGVEHE